MTITLAVATVPSAAEATPTLADAEAYVVGIYQAIPRDAFDNDRVRYAPELARLIRRDDACVARSGDICAIDAVPFCGCQDTANDYSILRSAVVARGIHRATVTVTLRNGGTKRFAIDLDNESGVWRVVDIHGPEMPSLLAHLRKARS